MRWTVRRCLTALLAMLRRKCARGAIAPTSSVAGGPAKTIDALQNALTPGKATATADCQFIDRALDAQRQPAQAQQQRAQAQAAAYALDLRRSTRRLAAAGEPYQQVPLDYSVFGDAPRGYNKFLYDWARNGQNATFVRDIEGGMGYRVPFF